MEEAIKCLEIIKSGLSKLQTGYDRGIEVRRFADEAYDFIDRNIKTIKTKMLKALMEYNKS